VQYTDVDDEFIRDKVNAKVHVL